MTINSLADIDAAAREKIFNALRDGVITGSECKEIGLNTVFAAQLQDDFANKKYVQIGDMAIFNRGREKHDDGKIYQRTRVEQCPDNNQKTSKSYLAKLWDSVVDFFGSNSPEGAAYTYYDDPEEFTLRNVARSASRTMAEMKRHEEAMYGY